MFLTEANMVMLLTQFFQHIISTWGIIIILLTQIL